jgi:hypothetical protein
MESLVRSWWDHIRRSGVSESDPPQEVVSGRTDLRQGLDGLHELLDAVESTGDAEEPRRLSQWVENLELKLELARKGLERNWEA